LFEFVELAIARRRPRRGLGHQLHDALLAGAGALRLGTAGDPADRAVRLY
jgi:hypothetical protein